MWVEMVFNPGASVAFEYIGMPCFCLEPSEVITRQIVDVVAFSTNKSELVVPMECQEIFFRGSVKCGLVLECL